MIRFCRPGTSSGGNSTPRSPRATMMPVRESMISSRWSIAAGFSSLAITAARPATSRRASATSSGRWTNDSATQSAPSSRPNCRSRRSLAVSGESGRTTFGTLTPLRSDSRPPTHHDRVGVVGSDLRRPAGGSCRRRAAARCRRLSPGRSRDGAGRRAAGRRARPSGRAGSGRRARARRAPRGTADPELRALQVHQDADRPAVSGLDLAHELEAPGVILVAAMGEIEAEDVGAGLEQPWICSSDEVAGPRVARIFALRLRRMASRLLAPARRRGAQGHELDSPWRGRCHDAFARGVA